MFNAYKVGISPNEWRKSQSSDFNFIREISAVTEQKQVRIKNQEALLKQMGY